MEIELTFKDKVYKKLMEMEGEFVIDQKVRPENIEAFIREVKDFIDLDYTKEYYIEFSSDYKKVRKVKL